MLKFEFEVGFLGFSLSVIETHLCMVRVPTLRQIVIDEPRSPLPYSKSDLPHLPRFSFHDDNKLNQIYHNNVGYQCPCKKLMTINDCGRLGNLMSQYMTLLLQSKRFGFHAIMSKHMARHLQPVFPHLRIPSNHLPCACNWTKFPASYLPSIKSQEQLLAIGENIYISTNPTPIDLFEQNYSLVIQEFAFNKTLTSVVQGYLKKIKSIFRTRMGFDQQTEVTIVGVHNRRTDYGKYLAHNKMGRLLSSSYFDMAMKMFGKVHGNATLFLMASDDWKWLLKHFEGQKNVFFTYPNWPHFTNNVWHDLAAMANSNHSIFR